MTPTMLRRAAASGPARRAGRRVYEVDFALIVITGNRTRYETIRPIVDASPEIQARWYPIRTWVDRDWLAFLPKLARIRLRHLLDAAHLLALPSRDAVVIHAFETHTLYAVLHRLLRRRAVIVAQYDGVAKNVPHPGPGLRGWLHRIAVEETDLWVPWSTNAANVTKQVLRDLPPGRVVVIPPGVDLRRWPARPDRPSSMPFRLLFVGADLERKGIQTLLAALQRLDDGFTLDVATQTASLTPELGSRIAADSRITLHLDLRPNSEALRQLYGHADAFVLPTNRDASPFVCLEAMASGLPVVITPVGGIPDMVSHDETGLLVPPGDVTALADALLRLRSSPDLCRRLSINGRARVERDFDAVKNTAELLSRVKALVDAKDSRKRQLSGGQKSGFEDGEAWRGRDVS